MRRSRTIQLTLLPLLASAAIASADPPGATAPLPPDAPPEAQLIVDDDPHALRPPGMVASVEPDCFQDPDQWKCQHSSGGAVVRGGFGHYFGTGGG